MREVVALFDTRGEAQRAIDALLELGYDSTRVGFMDRQRMSMSTQMTIPGLPPRKAARVRLAAPLAALRWEQEERC